ncbi:hypothetical protein E2A64_16700 [Pseudohoeflea suaedae]|uniref:Uncharacterized protein n=1 Tax=Pseudohoeflea suaedae TaxID=877384 RepID=A0A4R5PHD2_9HYPH|nr:hypothetical protein [Pseudohoeflea suaedae]TDH34310.1 hypothetical protein E2A64_16700 [Pseudohoeflea suaedae]
MAFADVIDVSGFASSTRVSIAFWEVSLKVARKIAVVTPQYSNLSGGIIALHKLADVMHRQGIAAFLLPDRLLPESDMWQAAKTRYLRRFRTNPAYRSQTLFRVPDLDDTWIVVYPGTIAGNPLKAMNVVRWHLNAPRELDPWGHFGPGELYFRFKVQPVVNRLAEGSRLSTRKLAVNDYPLHLYNDQGQAVRRTGTAYCRRKGGGRDLPAEAADWILIDGKSHEEVSAIFKSVERFVSYDTRTAYLKFAALCGCDAVVEPQEGLTEEQWKPDPALRYGVAYGLDRLDWARSTRHLLPLQISEDMARQEANVLECVAEMNAFFDARDRQG